MHADRRSLPPELREQLEQHTDGAELAQVWELLELAEPVVGTPKAEAAWAAISQRVDGAARRRTPTGRTRAVTPAVAQAPRWRRVAGTALAAGLALAVGTGVWMSRPFTVAAPDGAQYALSLPDGSQVELNAGSTLTFARGLRSRIGLPVGDRAVRLTGEAFFTVTHDASRPFVVHTPEARVTVLGTRFLVRARADDADGTRVAVESGRVRVATVAGARESVELAAGEGTVVAQNAAPRAAAVVGVERLTLWRRGGLAFVDQPLSGIVRELERRYAVEIRLRDVAAGVTDERITYYAGRPAIETVLSDLCTPRGLRFTRTSRGFEISPALETGPTTR